MGGKVFLKKNLELRLSLDTQCKGGNQKTPDGLIFLFWISLLGKSNEILHFKKKVSNFSVQIRKFSHVQALEDNFVMRDFHEYIKIEKILKTKGF